MKTFLHFVNVVNVEYVRLNIVGRAALHTPQRCTTFLTADLYYVTLTNLESTVIQYSTIDEHQTKREPTTTMAEMDAERVRAYLQVACAGLGFEIGEVWWTSSANGHSTVASIGKSFHPCSNFPFSNGIVCCALILVILREHAPPVRCYVMLFRYGVILTFKAFNCYLFIGT